MKSCGIDSSEVFSLLFWDNALIKSMLSDEINPYRPPKLKVDALQSFIDYYFFRKLFPPSFTTHQALKSLGHHIRFCKLIFLVAQNPDNRHFLMSEMNGSEPGEPLILHSLFNLLQDRLSAFADILESNTFTLTSVSRIERLNALCGDADSNEDDDGDGDGNDIDSDDDAKMENNDDFRGIDRVTVKSMECIQWCFCAIFMLSFDPQSRMEIVDFGEGVIVRHMISFFVILKHLMDHNMGYLDGQDHRNMAKCFDHIRSIFLVIKKLSKTVPFPRNLYNGHRGAIMLVAEILIYTQTLKAKWNGNGNLEAIEEVISNVYFHGISVLKFLGASTFNELQRYSGSHSEWHLIHLCGRCDRISFGFRSQLRFCKSCGHSLFGKRYHGDVMEDGINRFIPDLVSVDRFKAYYVTALKKFCEHREFRTFDNDVVFGIIVEYLDYGLETGDLIDYKDELGNWCLFEVKAVDQRKDFEHRIKVGMPHKKRWDQWIDSRSIRIDHAMTHTIDNGTSRDDLL